MTVNLDIQKFHIDKKYCACGCHQLVEDESWGLNIAVEGKIGSFEDCLKIIELFEGELEDLNNLTSVCNNCGKCCSNGPEITTGEMTYLKEIFPQYKDLYDKITPAKPCPFGGEYLGQCQFPKTARPLQCRILFCNAKLNGFETLFNLLAEYLDWTKIS